MKFRDAKKLKAGDWIIVPATDTLHQVSTVELFFDAKTVRIYTEDKAILYSEDVETYEEGNKPQ